MTFDTTADIFHTAATAVNRTEVIQARAAKATKPSERAAAIGRLLLDAFGGTLTVTQEAPPPVKPPTAADVLAAADDDDTTTTDAAIVERVQVGRVYLLQGEPHRAELVNACRCRMQPLQPETRTIRDGRTGKTVTIKSQRSAVNITPNAELVRVTE